MKTIIRFILYLFTLYFEAKNVILRQFTISWSSLIPYTLFSKPKHVTKR